MTKQTLKNGATVEMLIETDTDERYVLANTGGYQPYVTWAMDSEGNCYWGHYFAKDQFDEAKADLVQRAGL